MTRAAALFAIVLVFSAEALAQSSALPPVSAPATGIAAPRVGGYVQVRSTWEERIGVTTTLNRVRLGAEGALPNRFSYRVLAEFQTSGTARIPSVVSLRDAYIRWTRDWLALQAGQFKTPFSRNYVTSLTVIETVDRPAVVDALATKRDIGVMAEFSPIPEGSFSVGVFNGEGQNLPVNRDSTTLIVGRLVTRPFSQVSLGASGAAYQSDSTRWGFEASVEERGALVRGEWIAQHRHGKGPDDQGWFVLGAVRVLPWAQVVVQQEDMIRSYIGTGARIRATTVGANLDLGAGRTRLTLEYVARRAGAQQTSRRTGIAQLQVKF